MRNLPTPWKQQDFHQLHCQIEGVREFLLLNGTADFPTWDTLDLPDNEDGKIGPLINFQSIDYRDGKKSGP